TSFFQIKERTERFHVQSSLFQPNIRLGSSSNAYPNGINYIERAFYKSYSLTFQLVSCLRL
ncbi:hypothetical protein, partial [Vibrio sp. 10N.261.49.A3]|uniref:hypothetical protein n=1 Tax=Vibrio sp. 10N.261.49.A3 TaxID=3229669 RepID=UPI003552648E